MKKFIVFKQREGESALRDYVIHALTHDDAKKQFAQKMLDCNHYLSNDIVQLSVDEDGVPTDGWYDLQASIIVKSPDPNSPGSYLHDYRKSDMHLHCSQESIDEGFSFWQHDVYTWTLSDKEEKSDEDEAPEIHDPIGKENQDRADRFMLATDYFGQESDPEMFPTEALEDLTVIFLESFFVNSGFLIVKKSGAAIDVSFSTLRLAHISLMWPILKKHELRYICVMKERKGVDYPVLRIFKPLCENGLIERT